VPPEDGLKLTKTCKNKASIKINCCVDIITLIVIIILCKFIYYVPIDFGELNVCDKVKLRHMGEWGKAPHILNVDTRWK
jgi:hypothetical protein